MTQATSQQIPVHQLENVLAPIHQATGLSNEFYTDQKLFELERDQVMGKTWACVGFASDLNQNGSVKPVDFMGLPLLLMRNREGLVQVFHNVCSHRGMKLVEEAGTVQGVIRCPYHSWTYDLNGGLKGTPHVGGIDAQGRAFRLREAWPQGHPQRHLDGHGIRQPVRRRAAAGRDAGAADRTLEPVPR